MEDLMFNEINFLRDQLERASKFLDIIAESQNMDHIHTLARGAVNGIREVLNGPEDSGT